MTDPAYRYQLAGVRAASAGCDNRTESGVSLDGLDIVDGSGLSDQKNRQFRSSSPPG